MKSTVAVVKCGTYRQDEVVQAVKKLLSLLAIEPGVAPEKLLFKPNMLSARTPEEGVTTHPAVLEAAIRCFSNSERLIGDSPANAQKEIPRYWEKCGYANVSRETETKLVKFDKSFTVTIETKKRSVAVPVTDYLQTFKVVNVSKLKTHGLTVMTAAMKNLYGLIPGFNKSILHSNFITPLDFSDFLTRFYNKIKGHVYLNIVDAVISMEGNGPASGTLRESGFIAGGTDAVAVDMVCAKMIGADTRDIPFLNIYGKLYGLPEVEVAGDDIKPLGDFKTPSQVAPAIANIGLFAPFFRLMAKFFKITPHIIDSKCKKCYACIDVCPREAISRRPVIDKHKCIGCLCCFEVCPYKAVEIKKSLLARIFT